MQKPIGRLTRREMAEKYPNTWLGIANPKYKNNDGVTLESADIIYIDKSRDELARLQVEEGEDILDWYTNENGCPLGMLNL